MSEPVWLTRFLVDAIHHGQLREHGGSPGLRDEGLLESALMRPRNRWAYDASTDLATLAAAYGYGLAKNHPYVDGNKRVAFLAMYVFLELNAWILDAEEAEVVVVMRALAEGALEEDELAGWLRDHRARR